jgi:hypothetical protein
MSQTKAQLIDNLVSPITGALGSASAPTFSFTSDPDTGVYSPGANELAISTGGSGRLFVDATGNIKLTTSQYQALAHKFYGYGSPSYGAITVGATGSIYTTVSLGVDVSTIAGSNFNGQNQVIFPANGALVPNNAGTNFIGVFARNSSDSLLIGPANSAGISTGPLTVTSNSLGIGVSAPQSALHVAGGDIVLETPDPGTRLIRTSVAGGAIQLAGSSATTDRGLRFGFVSNALTFSEFGRFDEAGRLGISTTTPRSLLDIGQGSTGNGQISWHQGATTSYGNIWVSYNGAKTTVANGLKGSITVPNGFESSVSALWGRAATEWDYGRIIFYTDSPSTVAYGTAITPSERMRIDDGGRLLVGTSTARTPVSGVTPSFQIEGGNTNTAAFSIIVDDNTAIGSSIYLGKSRGTITGSTTIVTNGDTLGTVSFTGADGTALVSAARIDAQVDGTPGANDMPGRLVFSTTADGAASPTARHRISSTGTTNLFVTSADGFNCRLSVGAGTSTHLFAGLYSATDLDSGTVSFRIWSNGNVINTNNSYGAISDIKLKENIVEANSQWDDLKALQVRNYNFKEGQTHTQIGLVAQEAELVSPGLVSKSPDRDEDGNDLGTVTKSVNYSVLYMKAVKALQEAMERIEALEADVTQLKGE